MIDLSTTYLGLRLPHPLVVGAGPIGDDLDAVRRAEDAGAAAIGLRSLFEEQLRLEELTHDAHRGHHSAEAASYLPPVSDYVLGPDAYLEHVAKVKRAVAVPVIASLNGVTDDGWLHHAKLIADAGADALELNVYAVGGDPGEDAAAVEARLVAMVRHVVRETPIPIAVKLSPFYTALAHTARALVDAGARGLVLFNRFYQPDIDPEALDVSLRLTLSTPAELLLRLRWLALLTGRIDASLAASGGVHSGQDALKAVMAGADCVQMMSALLHHGVEHLATVKGELARWLEDREYESLDQAKGSMSLARSPRPEAYERANYIRVLTGYARR
ncbi:MAG: dihydroorotate dehydrogenase-like protein [Kofleriaceae bacterium]|nr:dihydroorotate dehydrogenase-like protein [Kofleriaceae bacterium]MBP9168183.1 dihydroorotate dehydrogenase-like protein [Kofleriaceae bacterium]MBP9856439.1 dihydroorotate dehydrogenase-like protein [Kofleriaceae bacterium]